MRRALILLIFVTTGVVSQPRYPVNDIAVELLKGANAVVRLDETTVSVKNPGQVVAETHFAITILNEKADEYATMAINYDKLQKVTDISGAMYDAGGRLIKKIKPKDIKDVSTTGDGNWEDDSRAKVYEFSSANYPFTVEYTYQKTINHTFFLPSWIPKSSGTVSLEKSFYKIDFPADFGVRYQLINTAEPIIKNEGDKKSYSWQITDLPVLNIPESFATWKDYIRAVFLAANDFQLGKMTGNMQTWKDLGIFHHQLLEGLDKLPVNVVDKVHQLVADAGSDREKVEILYNFLQQNTRYISIQLGVGGWVPFDAAYVAGKGYGDCKALNNYMLSLLKEAGISSYYTLVNAGRDEISRNRVLESFPSNQFNHVILCVPLDGDTMWLECTNQKIPAGYVGGFTANRKGLLIREDGGVLVSTPRYGADENKLIRNTNIKLVENGDAEIETQTTYTGLQQDYLFSMISTISPEKVKRILSNTLSISSYELSSFNYDVKPSSLPQLKETLQIRAGNYANMTGKRIFVTPNIFSRSDINLKTDTTRKTDFNFGNGYRNIDEVEIEIPDGYTIESAIAPVMLSAAFGKFSIECHAEQNKIAYKRILEIDNAHISVDKQNEVVDFFKEVYKADRARLVLVTDQ